MFYGKYLFLVFMILGLCSACDLRPDVKFEEEDCLRASEYIYDALHSVYEGLNDPGVPNSKVYEGVVSDKGLFMENRDIIEKCSSRYSYSSEHREDVWKLKESSNVFFDEVNMVSSGYVNESLILFFLKESLCASRSILDEYGGRDSSK